jgi:excisionase family DNA binding protein
MDPVTQSEVLTTVQAAELLQIRPEQIAIMAHRGELPAKMVAREWRFLRSKLMAFLAGEVEPPKPVQRRRGRPPKVLDLELLQRMGSMH